MKGVYTNEYCLFHSCVIPARASLSCVALSTDARINIALPYCVALLSPAGPGWVCGGQLSGA